MMFPVKEASAILHRKERGRIRKNLAFRTHIPQPKNNMGRLLETLSWLISAYPHANQRRRSGIISPECTAIESLYIQSIPYWRARHRTSVVPWFEMFMTGWWALDPSHFKKISPAIYWDMVFQSSKKYFLCRWCPHSFLSTLSVYGL